MPVISISCPFQFEKKLHFSQLNRKKISTKCMKQNGAIKISMTRLLLSSEIDSNDNDCKKFSNYLVPC